MLKPSELTPLSALALAALAEEAGVPKGVFNVVTGDRAAAIEAGVTALEAGDILIIAGKGHETGQIVGTETLPFDDAGIAREIIADHGGEVAQ